MNFTRKAGALILTLGSVAASMLSGCYSSAYVPARAVYYNNGYNNGYYARPAYYGNAGYYARPGYYGGGYAAPGYARPVVYAAPAPAYARPVYVAPRAGGYVRRW